MTVPGVQERGGATLEALASRLENWVRLDAQDRAAILALPHIVSKLSHHQPIVREGERASFCCLMLSGYAFRYKIVGTGHRQIMSIHMRGDVVDLQNALLEVADHGVEMLTDGKVALIPKEEMVRIAFERPNVGKAMWMDTLVDASIFREWIANVGRRDARTRIAHLLCEFALRLKAAGIGQEAGYELPITQEQLADATGLTPVHVNRTLKSLEEDGLIDRSAPRSIKIGDWQKLSKAADFDSLYLHLDMPQPA